MITSKHSSTHRTKWNLLQNPHQNPSWQIMIPRGRPGSHPGSDRSRGPGSGQGGSHGSAPSTAAGPYPQDSCGCSWGPGSIGKVRARVECYDGVGASNASRLRSPIIAERQWSELVGPLKHTLSLRRISTRNKGPSQPDIKLSLCSTRGQPTSKFDGHMNIFVLGPGRINDLPPTSVIISGFVMEHKQARATVQQQTGHSLFSSLSNGIKSLSLSPISRLGRQFNNHLHFTWAMSSGWGSMAK